MQVLERLVIGGVLAQLIDEAMCYDTRLFSFLFFI